MKAICLHFQVHQPFRYRKYRFFDIGNDHYYYDDYANETILRRVADRCYLPANKLILDLINKSDGKFKVSFSISGIALEQFEMYAPEVLESFKKLAGTGHVEFLAETYSHSLISLNSKEFFIKQIQKHQNSIESYFGQRPTAFCNTEFIYSDHIGADVAELGFKAILTEGAKHILGWKSPNYMYCNSINPRLKVLMRNFRLSDDITFHFSNQSWSEYPLTAKKFVNWINVNPKEEIVNIFLPYEVLGEFQPESTGIFKFMSDFSAQVLKHKNIKFVNPSETADELQPVSAVNVPFPISWTDEERDLTAWLGNEMQQEAFNKLYNLQNRMERVQDNDLIKDWNYLQVSNHFNYMSTKFFSNGSADNMANPYESPYEAFINYMNVMNDFRLRLNSFVPENPVEQEIATLNALLLEKEEKLKRYERELNSLQERKKRKSYSAAKREKEIREPGNGSPVSS